MTTLPCVPAHLLTVQDLTLYEQAMGVWDTCQREDFDEKCVGPEVPRPPRIFRKDQSRRLRHQLAPLHEQAVWMYLERLLADPRVDAVRICVSDDPYDDMFASSVSVLWKGRVWWCPKRCGPAASAQWLGSALWHCRQDLGYEWLFAASCHEFTRDTWLAAATAYLGPDWRVARETALRTEQTP